MKRVVHDETSITIVAPIYNEASTLADLVAEIEETIARDKLPGQWTLLLVNDGSDDGTRERLDELASDKPEFVDVLHLSRNWGHAAAVSAGLEHARGDAVILMDADMQDDPAAFSSFLNAWMDGADVVYAIRTSREDSVVLRCLSWLFYRVLGWIARIDVPPDAGNFALMDRRIVSALCQLPERNRYLPGLRAWLGFRQCGVPVPRRARRGTASRVGWRGLWRLAMNSVFSFSYVPLFAFRLLGALALVLSGGLIVFALYHKWVTGLAVPMWTSQLTAISFFGGVNLLGIGVVGEYVARIYDEVRARPAYIMDQGDSPTPSQKTQEQHPARRELGGR